MSSFYIKKWSLGTQIKKVRSEQGFTLEQVGAGIGVSRKTISKYEHDIIHPSLEHFLLLCIFLKTTPSVLLNDFILNNLL